MRHSQFRGRRPRPPSQWIPFVLSSTVASATVRTDTIVEAGASATSQQANIARLTIQRIRGTIYVENGAAAISTVSVGIAVVGVSNAAVQLALDPATLASSDYSWMFLRTYLLEPTANVGFRTNAWNLPMGAEIDVRVRRILRPQECLVLYASQVSGSAMNYFVNLRTLVSRVA